MVSSLVQTIACLSVSDFGYLLIGGSALLPQAFLLMVNTSDLLTCLMTSLVPLGIFFVQLVTYHIEKVIFMLKTISQSLKVRFRLIQQQIKSMHMSTCAIWTGAIYYPHIKLPNFPYVRVSSMATWLMSFSLFIGNLHKPSFALRFVA